MSRFLPRFGRSLIALLLLVLLAAASPPAFAVEPGPVVSISLRVLPDTPDGTARYDTMLRYVFTVTNNGDVLLTDITLTDTLCGAVGTAASLAPGSSLEFEGWARVESGEGVAMVLALAPGSAEVSATAAHAIDPYISHDWPDGEAAKPDPEPVAEQTAAPVAAPVSDADAAEESYLPFTGGRAAYHLWLAAGFAFFGITLRNRALAI